MSVQLQALADDVFDAAAALDRLAPPGRRPVASFDSCIAAPNTRETWVAMVQVFNQNPSPSGGGQGASLAIHAVEDEEAWRAFEGLIRTAGAEQCWANELTAELVALYRWRAENTPHRLYLAVDGDRAVACVGLFQHRSSAYLHSLFTHPEFRKRGAGTFLTLGMDSQARSVGCDRVVLQCPRESGLPEYFERLGFRVVGER